MSAQSSERGAGKSLYLPGKLICHPDFQKWGLLLKERMIKSFGQNDHSSLFSPEEQTKSMVLLFSPLAE